MVQWQQFLAFPQPLVLVEEVEYVLADSGFICDLLVERNVRGALYLQEFVETDLLEVGIKNNELVRIHDYPRSLLNMISKGPLKPIYAYIVDLLRQNKGHLIVEQSMPFR